MLRRFLALDQVQQSTRGDLSDFRAVLVHCTERNVEAFAVSILSHADQATVVREAETVLQESFHRTDSNRVAGREDGIQTGPSTEQYLRPFVAAGFIVKSGVDDEIAPGSQAILSKSLQIAAEAPDSRGEVGPRRWAMFR